MKEATLRINFVSIKARPTRGFSPTRRQKLSRKTVSRHNVCEHILLGAILLPEKKKKPPSRSHREPRQQRSFSQRAPLSSNYRSNGASRCGDPTPTSICRLALIQLPRRQLPRWYTCGRFIASVIPVRLLYAPSLSLSFFHSSVSLLFPSRAPLPHGYRSPPRCRRGAIVRSAFHVHRRFTIPLAMKKSSAIACCYIVQIRMTAPAIARSGNYYPAPRARRSSLSPSLSCLCSLTFATPSRSYRS